MGAHRGGRQRRHRWKACAHPRVVAMDELTLEIGRRPHPTPAGVQTATSIAIADSTVSSMHARIQRASQRRRPVRHPGSGQHERHLRRRAARRTAPTPLRDGAVIFLGSQVLVFRIVHARRAGGDRRGRRHAVRARADAVARAGVTMRRGCAGWLAHRREILLLGETGVGKEVFASAIHALSGAPGRLVAINCAAIPRELVESELFGYEKGAHSTAQGRKTGLSRRPTAGRCSSTRSARCRSSCSRSCCASCRTGAFTPLGSTRVVEADVRIIAATSRTRWKGERTCRRRCWAAWARSRSCCRRCASASRTSGASCALFPSRQHRRSHFEPEAFHALLLHDWPLNVRELPKVVTEAEVLSRARRRSASSTCRTPVTATLQVDGRQDEREDHRRSIREPRATGTRNGRRRTTRCVNPAQRPPIARAPPRRRRGRADVTLLGADATAAWPRWRATSTASTRRLALHPALRHRRQPVPGARSVNAEPR